MKKFTQLNAKAIPLPMRDVDTDMIIPAQYLTAITREGFGTHLFERLRESSPDFTFNQACYAGAKILISGPNFGCGSSREHAVWALMAWGIEAVIGSSFADIFSGNSAKNGLVLIKLEPELVDRLLVQARGGALSININLVDQALTLPGNEKHTFDFNPFRKHCIVEGLDDIDYILNERAAIDNFRAGRERLRFFKSSVANR